MKEFFDLYEAQSNLSLEVGHNSIADWVIIVYDKQSIDYELGQYNDPVIQTSSCDRNLAFATAYCELAEYLSDNRGGY
jgi:hypothetical protein